MPASLVCATVSLLALLMLAGCGSTAQGDPELTIYLSAPLQGPEAESGMAAAEGARAALAEAGGEAAGIAVVLEVLDDATPGGPGGAGWTQAVVGANARTATQDATAIAYLGELQPAATRISEPIVSEAGILQVPLADGSEEMRLALDAIEAASDPLSRVDVRRAFADGAG